VKKGKELFSTSLFFCTYIGGIQPNFYMLDVDFLVLMHAHLGLPCFRCYVTNALVGPSFAPVDGTLLVVTVNWRELVDVTHMEVFQDQPQGLD
jgi:hypothetical protein